MLSIPHDVDSSTGNVDYDGAVVIAQAVRDGMSVRATGNIEVAGLIGAAIIECGGDLIAQSGVAGRDRGKLLIRGNATAEYLEAVHGEVGGNLTVRERIVGCRLTVHGNIEAPYATLMGGNVSVTGTVSLGTLGSPRHAATRLELGFVPQLEPIAQRFEHILNMLHARRSRLLDEQRRLSTEASSPRERERQTELMFELGKLDSSIRRATSGLRGVMKEIQRRYAVSVSIAHQLHEGVLLNVRGQVWRIDRDVAGPLQISLDTRGVIWTREGRTAQLTEIGTLEEDHPSFRRVG